MAIRKKLKNIYLTEKIQLKLTMIRELFAIAVAVKLKMVFIPVVVTDQEQFKL